MGSLVLTHIEDVFKLLEKEDELTLKEYKDVILVLGNTGAGKSTFTHFLVGDNTKLQSVEIGSETGEYTINDDNNKIGAGHDSKTLYPERVVDRNSGIAYYDCPGFGDTRNAAYDIASNYFIKKITCHVRTVKIVLLVNYSSVRVGMDRFDFMKFIKHVTEFITNIEHFKNSIAVVVTKVENDCYKENGRYVTVSDNKVISKIANFISDAKICLEKKLHNASSNDEKVYYKKAITLVDILLQEDSQSNKVKIALFRRPDEAGVISEIDLLQKGKEIIRNMIRSKITFAKLNANDFGFSISDSSKNSVLKLFETISAYITEDISSTKEYFYESIKAQVKNSNDISHLNEELGLLYMQSKEILQKMQNSSNLKIFLVLLVDYLNLMDVRNGKSIFLKLFKKCEHIEFLEEISNERCLMNPTEWIKPLQDVLEYILQTKQWYVFLTDLYEKLSSYKLHTNVMNDKFLKKVIEKNEYINLSNLSKFVKFLKKHNMKVEVAMQNTDISDIQFQDLNNVFHALYINDVKITYSSRGDLFIKGNFVTSTDIIRNVQNHNKKSVYVFALNTFYINEDIDFTGIQVNLLIIAPKWEVIGERRIVLDGTSSEGVSMPKAKMGEDGRPGCPGGPAGCFFGFCCNVINDEFLTISANGGNGGPGQDGGDGIRGKDAVQYLPYGNEQQGKRILRNSPECSCSRTDTKSFFDSIWIKVIPGMLGFTAKQEIQVYKVKGREAEKGGDGHKAGCGGLGGFSETISLFGVVSKIKITNSNGRNGVPGRGGRGGKGGKNADDYTCIFTKRNDYWLALKIIKDRFSNWHVIEQTSNGYAPAGDDNTEITNVEIQEPESVILFENERYIINDYKRYLLSNLSNKISKSGLLKFYQYFSNNIHVKGTYDSLALAYEFIDLENEYWKSNNVEYSLYKDLLDRVLEHGENTKSTENTNDYKKLKIYLCSAILSKIVNMRSKSDDDLVIDIDSYFSLIINNFRDLIKSMDTFVKSEYNYSYKKAIDTKITEAKNLVKNIDREIDYINKEIESKMLKILQDICADKQKWSNEAFSETKENQLQAAVERKTTTGVLDFFKSILSYAFSFGNTINSIIQGACNIANSFGLGNLVNKNPIIFLIRTAGICISSGINYVQTFTGRKIEALKHFIETLFEKINKHSNELENIIQVVNKTLSYITTDDNNNVDPKKITSLIDQVKQEIQKKITNLENVIKNKQGGESFQILSILKKLFNTITLADAHTDTYLLYKDNEVELEQICASPIIDSCKVEALREFETYIHTNIQPTFLTMRNTIEEYETSLPSQSRIALDISRWKLQTVFKDIKILLKKFVEKFELDNDLLQILDKLDDAMNVFITIYDKIQHYNEQKELADYIAFMTSERCNKIPVENVEIKNTLIKLDHCIKANIIFGQFKKGIASFKQFIFPFASHYLEKYPVPTEMKMEEVNLENLVECTSKQIENLRSKMIENHSLIIKNFHQHIYEGHFQKGEKFGPFCIWESNKCTEAISRLLSGEEIVLHASILKNHTDKNAIKFNAIQINFSSHDKSLEEKLNSELKHFDVTATHMGNSYYRCNNRYYLLTSDSQFFHYSFEKDRTGEPIRKNEVYSKIKEGPYLLSPYATWSFQLKNVSGNFSELNEFKGKTDLELIGRGQYVSDECFISDDTLNKYYKVVDYLSVTDLLKS